MHGLSDVVVLLAVAVLGAALARRLGLLSPILLVVVGLVLSFVPGFIEVRLEPELVLGRPPGDPVHPAGGVLAVVLPGRGDRLTRPVMGRPAPIDPCRAAARHAGWPRRGGPAPVPARHFPPIDGRPAVIY